MTPKGLATRARIVEGAARLLRERNVVETTLDDVLAATGTSKGQLFHYFPDGKDQLLLAVAEHEADRVLDDQRPHLDDLSTWESWEAWRDTVLRRYREMGDTCPLGTLFLQVGRGTPGARAIARGLMSRWQARLAAGMVALQDNGLLDPAFDVDRAAPALLAAVQGGVSILLSTGSDEHLGAALDFHLAQLRAAAVTRASGRRTGA
ncbi:TetR/AcrR family transcriptional regulator [Saccharothrix xinjiangensis]